MYFKLNVHTVGPSMTPSEKLMTHRLGTTAPDDFLCLDPLQVVYGLKVRSRNFNFIFVVFTVVYAFLHCKLHI